MRKATIAQVAAINTLVLDITDSILKRIIQLTCIV